MHVGGNQGHLNFDLAGTSRYDTLDLVRNPDEWDPPWRRHWKRAAGGRRKVANRIKLDKNNKSTLTSSAAGHIGR